ncbi:MAG TPA: PIG-L family deacetylase, partial [Vicinamibacterales bacterium]|nr:PIG-L family deacetylase [Vicinamibacterales bacterium]
MRTRLALISALALSAVLSAAGTAPTENRGHTGLALMLRKLATTGTVMFATAHPDDEHNPLIARLAHGDGLRVVVATATRGSGGQNEIGPELFQALGVLRTEELLSTHRYDGADQLFARAVDFGYSFSVEECFEKWGRREIVGDYVRLIRQTRPDVIITMRPDGGGGGQAHQAIARLASEAAELSADPSAYPEYASLGLRPWRPARVFRLARYGFPGEPQRPVEGPAVTVQTDVYDSILGRTYAEVGSEARSMHKSQGFGQLLALPGTPPVVLVRADAEQGSGPAKLASVHEGLDLSLEGLAVRFAGARPPAELTRGLRTIAAHVAEASQALNAGGPAAAAAPLAAGLGTVRDLRLRLDAMSLDESAAAEIDFRLARTERKFESALLLAQGLRLEALADDGVVTPGQPMTLTLIAANRGAAPIDVTSIEFLGVDIDRSECRPGALAASGVMRCEASARIAADARVTEPYWRRVPDAERYEFDPDVPFGVPFRPTPFEARLSLRIAGQPIVTSIPVEYRYEGNIFSGEKRMELHVVPAITTSISPGIVVSSGGDASVERKVRVTVQRNGPGPSDATVRLALPDGWSSEPASERVQLTRADEAVTVQFALRPGTSARTGRYTVRAVVEADGHEFGRGFHVIEYPHTRRRHLFEEAVTTVQVLDVTVPEGLEVGYIMGVGDQVPPAIEQIGARVTMLGPDDLAWGDLSRFDAIVTGVRAYERRQDLRAYNHRLLQYATEGGTVLVQYNKFEFNQAQYGPYPAKVSAARVADEHSPVVVLEPEHPVFTRPNPITEEAWKGWTQERGLYFLGDRDPRYVDLVELSDPFENNPGPKRGALVEARVGRGRWIYVGLGLWRQLPAGTEGAYRLLANLISLRRTDP